MDNPVGRTRSAADPGRGELAAPLSPVLEVLSLIFSEGDTATGGRHRVRV